MNREPSAHSMTVEPIEHVEDIAAELFKLRQWKAEAVVTIGKLEGERDEALRAIEAARQEIARLGEVVDAITAERDEAKRNLDGLLVAGFNTPPGECTNCAEMRVNLSVAEVTASSLRDRIHEHDRARREAYDEMSDLKSRVESLRQANAAQEQRFGFLTAMVRGALEAI